MPRVSVIIPSYNYGHFIRAAIDSVLAQTFRDFEIIVVDDGSTDATAELLKPYVEKNQIHYLYQKNKGLPGARNTGIVTSTGSLIAFLDSDDLWTPDKLALQVAKFDERPSVGVVYGNTRKFFDQMIARTTAFDDIAPARGQVTSHLLQRTFLPMPSVVVRRTCFDAVGLFDEPLQSPGEDIDMWLSLSLQYDFEYVDQVVAFYRLHATSISANVLKIADRRLFVLDRFLHQHQAEIDRLCPAGLAQRVLFEAQVEAGKYAAAVASPAAGRVYLRQALASQPRNLYLRVLSLSTWVPGLLPTLYKIKIGKIRQSSFERTNKDSPLDHASAS